MIWDKYKQRIEARDKRIRMIFGSNKIKKLFSVFL